MGRKVASHGLGGYVLIRVARALAQLVKLRGVRLPASGIPSTPPAVREQNMQDKPGTKRRKQDEHAAQQATFATRQQWRELLQMLEAEAEQRAELERVNRGLETRVEELLEEQKRRAEAEAEQRVESEVDKRGLEARVEELLEEQKRRAEAAAEQRVESEVDKRGLEARVKQLLEEQKRRAEAEAEQRAELERVKAVLEAGVKRLLEEQKRRAEAEAEHRAEVERVKAVLEARFKQLLEEQKRRAEAEAEQSPDAKFLSCAVYNHAVRALEKAGIDPRLLNRKHDRCYCSACYPGKFPNVIIGQGNQGPTMYVVPRGWVRIGLKVPPFAETEEVWDKWSVSFHGCKQEWRS